MSSSYKHRKSVPSPWVPSPLSSPVQHCDGRVISTHDTEVHTSQLSTIQDTFCRLCGMVSTVYFLLESINLWTRAASLPHDQTPVALLTVVAELVLAALIVITLLFIDAHTSRPVRVILGFVRDVVRCCPPCLCLHGVGGCSELYCWLCGGWGILPRPLPVVVPLRQCRGL